MKSLGIIIPVFNQCSYTKRLVLSFMKQKITKFDKVYYIFINNNSTDETSDYLTTLSISGSLETVYQITNTENKGYGPAVNQGIKLFLSYEPMGSVLVMNNDMEIMEDTVDKLVEASEEKEDCGIVGGKLLFPDGNVQHGGAFLNLFGWGQHRYGGCKDSINLSNLIVEQEYVTGALFFITNKLLQKLNSFDERFGKAFFEEVDFCYEARKLGYKTYYTPFSKAIHYENITGKEIYHDQATLKKALSDTNQIKFHLKREEEFELEPSIELKDKVLLTCKIYGPWSFSGVMRNLAKGLKRNKVDVSIAPEEYHNVMNMEDWEIKEMIEKPKDYWNRVVVRSCEGDHMYLMPPGKKRIAHTTGESTRVNKYWIQQLNHTDQVLTTSQFFKSILLESGIKTRVDVLPNSIDLSIFNPQVPKLNISGLRGFNFYSVFPFGDRKAPDILLKAYFQEFKEDEDVSLTIHSLSMEYSIKQNLGISLGKWIDELAGNKSHAPVLLSSNYMREEVLAGFASNFDVFVFPSRAEGFGLGLVEAGAMGIPCIATYYSGMTDYLSYDVGWNLEYKLVDIPLQYLPYYKNYVGGKWAEPSVEHLRELMRYVYSNREEVKRKGKKALEVVKTNYSIEEVGRIAKTLIFN